MTLYIIEVRAKRKGAKWKPAIDADNQVACFATARSAGYQSAWYDDKTIDVRVSKVKVERAEELLRRIGHGESMRALIEDTAAFLGGDEQ